MQQIKGIDIALRVGQLISSGIDLEEVLYSVVKENIQFLPKHLREDLKKISTILHGVMFYVGEYSGKHLGYEIHDIVLKRLLPKRKTERYIQSLFEEI